MKKITWLAILTSLILMVGSFGTVHAEIIPASGMGQIGLQAAVLCDTLTLRQEPSSSSKALQTLHYRDLIIVTEQQDGWARVVLGDSEDAASGWVNADYIAIDPAWYRTEEKTPVYAWSDAAAPKVALLDANTEFLDPETFLPILKDEGEWIVVSLRGAVGSIYVGAGRQDGNRCEDVIMLEGMEETIQYERIRNENIGFEMAYDYERFSRYSASDRECFISRYDDPNDPVNYLEVTRSAEDAETTAAAVGEALSGDYDIIVESFALDGAGECIRIDASAARDGSGTPDLLQVAYIIPAGDGSIIATSHYSFESAEGFGVRFQNMIQTIAAIGGQE